MKKKGSRKSGKKNLNSSGTVSDKSLADGKTLLRELDFDLGRVFKLAGLSDELSVHATFIVLLGGTMMMDVT